MLRQMLSESVCVGATSDRHSLRSRPRRPCSCSMLSGVKSSGIVQQLAVQANGVM
jgi:hypothetical protein